MSIIYIHSLRGAGDTRYPLLITMVGVCIRVLAGYVCGIVLNGGLLGAWMGMYGDNVWRAIAGTVRYSRGRWIKTQV